MRVFVAINLPEHVKSEIFHPVEKLKNAGLVSGSFVDKNNLHLTLKFLGEVSEEQITKIEAILGEIKFKSFEAKTGKIGFFPNQDYIRVVWLELISKEINNLKQEIEKKLINEGFKNEEREFSEHITLARIKEVKDKQLFVKGVSSLKIKEMNFKIGKFSLIKSELTKTGPKYKTLKEFPAS